MRFAVMVEGQEDVTWEQWLALAATGERLGFEALLRSDHYGSVDGDAARAARWTRGPRSAGWRRRSTLRLGTLVSPATFRHPSVLAKSAVTADHISGGRIELGIGTGWHAARAPRLRLPVPADEGPHGPARRAARDHRRLVGARPVLVRRGALRGRGPRRAAQAGPGPAAAADGRRGAPRGAALAARFATEYNVVHQTPEEAERRASGSPPHARDAGRDPATMTFSLMHGFLIGADEDDLRERASGCRPHRHDRRGAARRLARRDARAVRRAAARVRGGGRRARDAAAPRSWTTARRSS